MKSVTVVRSSSRKLTESNGQSQSKNLQIEGDLLAEDGKLFEALECYNKSLCVAQSSDDISSAYECRSVVYFKAKEYQLCLKNIELAVKNCDNISRLEILNNWKKMCEELIAHDRRNVDDDDPWKFFQLSHQPNDKIPFIIDCLELHNNKKYGRFIITNQG